MHINTIRTITSYFEEDSDDEKFYMSARADRNTFNSYQKLLDYKHKHPVEYDEITTINIQQSDTSKPIEDLAITELLPENLWKFMCIGVNIVELPNKLPEELNMLDIKKSTIDSLPELPNSLTFLTIYNNCNIKRIDKLPEELYELKLFNLKKFVELPYIPDDVEKIYIETVPISKLQNIPNKLTYFQFHQTNIAELPLSIVWCDQVLNDKITIISSDSPLFGRAIAEYNPSTNTDTRWGYIKHYIEKELKPIVKEKVRIIENWFLDCKYNPKYKYCKKRLMDEYEELNKEMPTKKLKK